MLLQNIIGFAQYPLLQSGGVYNGEASLLGLTDTSFLNYYTRFVENNERAGIPNGYNSNTSWIPPLRSGGVAVYNSINGVATVSVTNNGSSASIQATSSLTSNISSILNAIANIEASGIISSSGLGALISIASNLISSGSISGSNLKAIASLNSNISVSATDPLSPDNLASAVWNSQKSLYSNTGTFGEVLNNGVSGGSGGSGDWTINEKTQIRYRLGIDGTKSLPLDSIPGLDIPTVNQTASQVRNELATELSKIDSSISSRATQISVNEKPSLTQIENSNILAKTSDISSSQSSIINEINANEIKIDSLKTSIDNLPNTTSIANAIWDELLSNHTIVGSAGAILRVLTSATIASSVRTELATELARIDANITSRLSSGSYSSPPSPSIIASQIRTELTTELSRIDAIISSRATQASVDLKPSLTQIENSSVLAKEATVATKASQTSVSAIPTNPLLSSDNRLNNLDATISSRLPTSAYVSPETATNIALAVWSATTRSLNIDVNLTSTSISAIATQVQAGIINEGDGQQVVNAIVQAIGNINVPANVIADAVRSNLATELSRIDVNISTRSSQDSVYGLY